MAPASSYQHFLLLLPLLGVSALSPSDCPTAITWTATGLKLADLATPNLITLKADRRRTLELRVSSPALPAPLECVGDTGTYREDTARQFNTWTYNCWDTNKERGGAPDATFAFQFESAFADEESRHPAKVSLRQRCGSGEVEGTADITVSCKMPDGCGGPCFDRECSTSSFSVRSG